MIQSISPSKFQSSIKFPLNREEKNEQENIIDLWSPDSKKKLKQVLQFIKKTKDERRAHYLAMNLPSRMLKSFDQNKFDLLNDKAFHYNKQTYDELISEKRIFKSHSTSKQSDTKYGEQSNSINQSAFLSIEKKYEKQDSIILDTKNQIPVISPSNHFKFIWDLIYMIVIIICLFYLPITIAFDFYFSDMFSYSSLVIIPTLIVFNIFLKINTGYFKKGQVIASRYQIIKKYFKQTFPKDILCVFPLVFTMYYQANNIEQQEQYNWTRQYVAGFYFMTVTMITVGYGDILPQNQNEEILCVITMMIACGVFGYSLNEVGSIFNNFFQVDREINRKQILIQRFMSTKNINTKLQYQIREYLDYYWREQAETDYEEKQMIIDQLSDSLRQKLLFEANKIVLRDNPIFKQNFSKNVIEQTVPLIQEMKYSPESIICQKGIQDDNSIYFIENGSVEIMLNPKGNNQSGLVKLKKGESFGAYSFFTGLPRINNIRSNEFTTVLKIKRQDFLQLLSMHSEDYETFCFIRDQISYLNDYSRIGQVCKSCNSSYHMVNDCQYLHYIPNKARIIKRYNDDDNNQQTERVAHQRRSQDQKYHFKNSLAIYNDVMKQNLMFLELNESILNQSGELSQYSQGYFNIESQDYEQVYSKNHQIDANEFKKESNQIADIEVIKEQEFEGSTQIIKKNTLSKFGQDYNHTKTKSFNSLDKQLQSGLENGNDVISLSIPDQAQQYAYSYTNSPVIDYENLPKRNAMTPQSRGNIDKHINSSNRLRTNTYDRHEIGENYQTFSSQVNFHHINESANKQYLSQRLKSHNEDFQEQNDKIKKQKQLLNSKSHKEFTLINFEDLEQTTPSSEYRKKNSSDLMKKKLFSQYKFNSSNSSEQIQLDQILKQIQLLVVSNQQKMNNQEKESNLIKCQIDIFENFDKMRQFVKYNPRYNYSSVISRFNQMQDQQKRASKIKKSYRGKRKTTYQQGKTLFKQQDNNTTQQESKYFQKNNYQNANYIYENTESKMNSKKANIGSLKKYDSDLEPFAQGDSLSQKFILSPISGEQLSFKIDGQVPNFMNFLNSFSQDVLLKKDISNRFNYYHSEKNDMDQDQLNNCEINSEESNKNKSPKFISFNKNQINVFNRNNSIDQ
ncbi:cation channel family protein (macronuclear) [Tetrahymena thermophila SB210]|uniref:Cation channel family protein n=1 Tax=Tetrahymena thermophila (strain SB210) TaxID=312017 RepID=W7X6G1_TETTS|nr:cation channel family protein [Tetrahymena thermophila SB210]EWS74975.1 cation channel family protein [Tetrahymena thermophila SB210]|eukprot:XP_012652516.1 cation channel family protein [Tetrahymena thermophila SB210]